MGDLLCWPYRVHGCRYIHIVKAEDGCLDAHLEAQPFKTPDDFLDMSRDLMLDRYGPVFMPSGSLLYETHSRLVAWSPRKVCDAILKYSLQLGSV